MQIYRIYDTIEQRHRDDMFIGSDGYVYKKYINDYGREEVGYIDQSEVGKRYIVEPCTGLYDKNNVLIYENDVAKVGGYVEGFMPIQAIVFNKDEGSLGIYDSWGGRHNLGGLDIEILGHAIRDEHLLSGK